MKPKWKWLGKLGNQKKSNNAADTISNTAKKPREKSVSLQIADKHEPFGTLSIDKIKQVLLDEDFAEMQSLFFFMMRDLKISSAVLTRHQQLVGTKYKIMSDNQAFIDWINNKQAKVPIKSLVSNVATGIYYGVSLTDVSYEVKNGLLVPKFEIISPRFMYADTSMQELKTTADHVYVKQGDKKRFIKDFEDDRVVFHKHAIDIGEITDFSLASKLVWYFSLKHIALSHNLQYFDNVATPPLIAKTDGDEDDLIDALYDLKSASVGVFVKDDVIEYLSVENKADFLNFIEYIDRQIATLILGNTLSTGEGKAGSYSQSQTHENRQKDVLKFDAGLIEDTIADYLNALERLNFANPKGVEFSFDIKEKKDLKELSEVVKNLTNSGYELDSEDIESQFGFRVIGKSDAAQSSQSNNSVVSTYDREQCNCASCASLHKQTHAQRMPVDALDQQHPATEAIETELLNSVLTALKQADSYEQAYQVLLELYADMPLETLENALFKAMANSEILANAEVNQETNGEASA